MKDFRVVVHINITGAEGENSAGKLKQGQLQRAISKDFEHFLSKVVSRSINYGGGYLKYKLTKVEANPMDTTF